VLGAALVVGMGALIKRHRKSGKEETWHSVS
jgi:hypothetical protein